MSEVPASNSKPPKKTTKGTTTPKRGSVGLIFVTFLVLAALSASGYVLWRMEFANPIKADTEILNNRISQIETWYGQHLAAVAESEAEMRTQIRDLENLIQEQQTAINRYAKRLALVGSAKTDIDDEQWRITEVEYLLRIANLRLLLDRNVPITIALLDTADKILAQIDDFSLHDIRSKVVSELEQLRNLEPIDQQGISLRIRELQGRIDGLPVGLPDLVSVSKEHSEDTAQGRGYWNRIVDGLESIILIRHHDSNPVRPLIDDQAIMIVKQQMRLSLDRALIALIRQDAGSFLLGIDDTSSLVTNHFDDRNETTRKFLDFLQSLREATITQKLPDISGSLQLLKTKRTQTVEVEYGEDIQPEDQPHQDNKE